MESREGSENRVRLLGEKHCVLVECDEAYCSFLRAASLS